MQVIRINADILADTLKLIDPEAVRQAIDLMLSSTHIHLVGFLRLLAEAVPAGNKNLLLLGRNADLLQQDFAGKTAFKGELLQVPFQFDRFAHRAQDFRTRFRVTGAAFFGGKVVVFLFPA